MYKDFTRVCQEIETEGYRYGVTLAHLNPPKHNELAGFWKCRLRELSPTPGFSATLPENLSTAEIKSLLWLVFESAVEDGMEFVAQHEKHFNGMPAPTQISEF